MNIKDLAKKIPFLKKKLKKMYLKRKSGQFKKISKKVPADPKLVVFESFQGRSYSCSPKAIYQYMLSAPEFKDFSFIWVFRDLKAHGEFPSRTRLVRFDTEEALKAYAAAGTWIVNSRLRDFYVPKDSQRYIQCWHGTPFKKIGCDIRVAGNATSTVREIYEEYTEEAKRISLFLSPCDFTSAKLISAFNLKKIGKQGCIVQEGYPRNDALFRADPEAVKALKARLSIPDGKKVVLYCPTFRDSQYNKDGYVLQPAIDFQALREKCADGIVVLFRAHYFIANAFDFEDHAGYVRNVSDYDDINDLYLVSDVLITDYSSVFFDFANLRRPMLFYLYDYEKYKNNMREFYFDIAALPGPTVQTQEELQSELAKILKDLDSGGDGLFGYAKELDAFNQKFNPLEDGRSAKRVTRLLFG